MKQPFFPVRGQPIRAEDIRSHAEAIMDLHARVRLLPTRQKTPFPIPGGKSGRFKVSASGNSVRVSPGTVVYDEGPGGVVTRPMMPTIGGELLTASPAPSIDASAVDVDVEYEVVCVSTPSSAKIILKKVADEPDFSDAEKGRQLATIKWKLDGGERKVDEFSQTYLSDIEWGNGGDGGSSGDSADSGSDGDSTGGSGSDGDESSGVVVDSMSDDSDSSGSDDSSSSSCGQSFPNITNLTAEIIRIDGSSDVSCMMEDETNSPVLRPVTVRIIATLDVGAPADCRLILYLGAGNRRKGQAVANELGGGRYFEEVVFDAFPCQEYTATARIVADPISGATLGTACCLTGQGPESVVTLTMPGLCSNFGACP